MLKQWCIYNRHLKKKILYKYLLKNIYKIQSASSKSHNMDACKNKECLSGQDQLLSKKYYRRAEHR